MDAVVEEMPTLNEKWFRKRLDAIRGASERLAEVELRCLIRELHVAFRFREVKVKKAELLRKGGR